MFDSGVRISVCYQVKNDDWNLFYLLQYRQGTISARIKACSLFTVSTSVLCISHHSIQGYNVIPLIQAVLLLTWCIYQLNMINSFRGAAFRNIRHLYLQALDAVFPTCQFLNYKPCFFARLLGLSVGIILSTYFIRRLGKQMAFILYLLEVAPDFGLFCLNLPFSLELVFDFSEFDLGLSCLAPALPLINDSGN